jgi:hypothetical protein
MLAFSAVQDWLKDPAEDQERPRLPSLARAAQQGAGAEAVSVSELSDHLSILGWDLERIGCGVRRRETAFSTAWRPG